MSFEDVIQRHMDHTVVIIPRLHKGRLDPVPGLYCENCGKLIKWLSPEVANDLTNYGVETLDMIPEEKIVWQRRQNLRNKNRLITCKELDI